MQQLPKTDHSRTEELPTDLLAGLLMELGRTPATAQPGKLPLKIWCVMAVTTVLTFATLTTGYQMLFARHLFA
jgi:hypothetical protein